MDRTAANKEEVWKTTMEDIFRRNVKFRYQLLGRLKADCDITLAMATDIQCVCGLKTKSSKSN